MNETTCEKYNAANDPEMQRYWMQKGPKTAAFLLIIPGCTIIGYGIGILLSNPYPCAAIGFGAGLVIWGFIVALTK